MLGNIRLDSIELRLRWNGQLEICFEFSSSTTR